MRATKRIYCMASANGKSDGPLIHLSIEMPFVSIWDDAADKVLDQCVEELRKSAGNWAKRAFGVSSNPFATCPAVRLFLDFDKTEKIVIEAGKAQRTDGAEERRDA